MRSSEAATEGDKPERRRAVTMSDVAQVARVSVATVSNVLQGTGRVSAETRARVLQTADRLDYRPNGLAQSFASGRSRTIGLLAEDASEAFSMLVLVGAEKELARQGLAVLLADGENLDGSLRTILRDFEARQVDGVLVVGRGPSRPFASLSTWLSAPVVYAHALPISGGGSRVLADNARVGELAAEHLIHVGHRRLAAISVRDDHAAALREQGFLRALSSAGLTPSVPEPMRGDWSREWGAVAVQQLLDDGVDVDGIFCANDPIAHGAYVALRRAGRSVPEDVALIGHDFFSRRKAGRVGQQFLTTFDPNLEEVGRRAAQQLIAAIRGEQTPEETLISPTLVEGVSTLGRSSSADAQQDLYDLIEMLEE
ncbi:MAG: LacI family DNA-binding transcriptional regulator [Microbacterium sp.]